MNGTQSIVVTGCGLIGPFGAGEDAFVSAIAKGVPCGGPCTWFETRRQVAQVRDFRLADHIKNPRADRSPRISQFALAAAAGAIRQAGIDPKRLGSESTAIVYGTGNGPAVSSERSLEAITTRGLTAVEPLVFQESVFNAPASLISIQFGIKGPAMVLPMCWTAGLYALKQGWDLLRRGSVERVLVVAADELAHTTLEALARLGFVSPNDGVQEATRPFDPRANGAIFGEGAVALMLERAADVGLRGGRARARIAGAALGGDAAGPGAPDTSGKAMARVMARALAGAGRSVQDPDYVVAGTIATRESDLAECNGLQVLLAERQRPIPVASLKSVLGETVGPAGLFNLVAAICAIEQSRVFGNGESAPPDRPGLTFPRQTQGQPVASVLVNSLGVSGTYAAVLVEAP